MSSLVATGGRVRPRKYLPTNDSDVFGTFTLTLGLGTPQVPPLAGVVPHHPEKQAPEKRNQDPPCPVCIRVCVLVEQEGFRLNVVPAALFDVFIHTIHIPENK